MHKFCDRRTRSRMRLSGLRQLWPDELLRGHVGRVQGHGGRVDRLGDIWSGIRYPRMGPPGAKDENEGGCDRNG
jgi:hypothetical protein